MGDSEGRQAPDATPLPAQTDRSPQPRSNCNLYLIGYRGSGKTTVARVLAQQLGRPWIDMDELLESRAKLSIRAIFEQEREAGFREREAVILEEISRLNGNVIATGGGVVLSPANRQVLRATGQTVFLTAHPRTLWQRMQDDPTTTNRRPTLTVGGPTEIEELLKAREPFYQECAHCTVATEGRSPEEVAALIRAHLNLS